MAIDRMRWWLSAVKITVALVLALAATRTASACPTQCQCIGTQRVSVYCDFLGLSEVPSYIPLETTHLYLMGNKFSRVLPEMLVGYSLNDDGSFSSSTSPLPQLKVLRLDLNPLAIVDEHAFETVPSLELIYLPFDIKIQRRAMTEAKTDKLAFDGYARVATHPLEDPHFAAFARE